MIARAEHSVHKDGHTITLQRGHHRGDLSWPPVGRETARAAISALGELSELMRPLGFGVTRHVMEEIDGFVVVDRQYPDRWNWYLRTPDTPSFAHPAYVDSVVVEAETVDETSMFEMTARALDDPCGVPPDHWVDWGEMYVHDTMVRVPRPPGAADHLAVDNDSTAEHIDLADFDTSLRSGSR